MIKMDQNLATPLGWNNVWLYTMVVKKNQNDQNGPKSCWIRECVTCDRM